jgi:succinate dehydrogenase flavin-adding protein (antitoxin of CptAB toxin-antitoxin module)
MDYLLSKFADSELSNLDNQEVVSYASLLDQEDPYIYDWIMSKAQVPLEFTHIIDRIKNFHSKV